MTAQVIEIKRQPPLWSVKVRHRYQATFHGPDARAQAEAFATENYGTFEVLDKAPTGKALRREAAILVSRPGGKRDIISHG